MRKFLLIPPGNDFVTSSVQSDFSSTCVCLFISPYHTLCACVCKQCTYYTHIFLNRKSRTYRRRHQARNVELNDDGEKNTKQSRTSKW